MVKKLLLTMLCIILCTAHTIAQDAVVTGRVTDATGPVPGATIRVKNTTLATQSAANGSFSIRASGTDVLVISFVGYRQQEIPVNGRREINVRLVTDASNLQGVVITGQGIARNKNALAYDVPTVGGKEIAETQRENFINSLAGRVAGATITATNGLPGSSSQIVLRGGVSLDGDNQPLFVVDGLPISNKTFSEYNLVNQGSYNRTNDYGNRGMDINPEDIETVTILKGPEASALYGTEGASGAVVITTKRAKAGVLRAAYSNSFRVERAYRFPDIQTVYGGGAGGIFDEEVRTRTYFGGKYPEGKQLYDNVGTFYKTGFTQKHNFSAEGGSEKLSLRSSLSYTDQNGYLPSTGYNNVDFKVSGVSKLGEKVNITGSVNFVASKTDKIYKGSGSAMLSSLSWPLVDDMRNYIDPLTGGRRTITGILAGELDNPYWAVNKNPNEDKLNRTITNVSIEYTPTKWFSAIGRVGTDFFTQSGISAYHPQSYASNVSGSSYSGGGINTYTDVKRMVNASLIGTFRYNWGDFHPIVRLGADLMDDRDEVNAQFGTKFYEQDYYSMNNTDPTTQRVNYSDVRRRKIGMFGQAELGYSNFLYLTLTGRNDYSSTLPIGNYQFFYPAASLSFVFSNLGALKNSPWLSYGKLRGSWGQSGKDARSAYITATRLIAQSTTGGGFASDVTAGNPNLVAEFTTSSEAGFDLGFFNNRLSLNATFYQRLSDKQITAPRLSYATGAVLGYINSGKIRNRGIELTVKGSPVRNENFTWDISANISKNKGKLIALPAGQDVFYLSDTWITDFARVQYNVGTSLLAISARGFMKNNAGQLLINPANGLPIRDGDYTWVADRTPKFTLGVSNNLTYKNFNLSFLFDIKVGGAVYNATEEYLFARGLSRLSLDREIPRIIEGVFRDGLENSATPTKNNIVVKPYITTSYYSTYYNPADFIQPNVNWVRLKDLTFSYNLPKTFVEKSRTFKTASVFVTGTDLLMFTNYNGVDPQTSGLSAASGGLGGTYIDFGSAGQPIGLNFGIRVGF